jgi:hypothetical protein
VIRRRLETRDLSLLFLFPFNKFASRIITQYVHVRYMSYYFERQRFNIFMLL